MCEVRKKKREVIFLVFLVLLDQLSKQYAKRIGFFSVNRGISFGLSFPVIFPICIFLILVILVYQKRVCFGFWLIIAGGISNLIDRIFGGGVVDFISLPFFPSFNLADVFISLGMILALVCLMKKNE